MNKFFTAYSSSLFSVPAESAAALHPKKLLHKPFWVMLITRLFFMADLVDEGAFKGHTRKGNPLQKAIMAVNNCYGRMW
jgi:hypothetical protein